ncbi:BTB/POZ domain-containing protein 9 [Drosophila sechellia]|uniref:BTB/POZ domain-containing protein 9 n=1 Tax=Drosophila sechellia TaxID=7238 RepID=UPI0013DDD291|nr:BTB/POZ domain-containing protein 9 [Drosophila sechellia]
MSSQGHHKMSGGGKNGTMKQDYTDVVDLGDRFSADMARLCMNEQYADMEFIVEEERLPAHRVILAARSEYFRALLYGGMAESTQHQIPLEVPLDAFKVLLRYIYSGTLLLSTLDEDSIIDVLGMANQYGFQDLKMAISNYLRQYLALDNVCMILDAARLYNLDKLTEVCLMFMDRNAEEVLLHDTFDTLSKESLEEVLRRDCFFAPEVQIFSAVWKWIRFNSNVDFKSVVSCVRLPLMTLEHLLQVVRPSGILDPDKILDAINERSTSTALPYRAALWPEENVAAETFLSRCIQGECRDALLDGDVTSYDMENGYTRHCITDCKDVGIVVELGTFCMINHIRMLLWDRDSRAYSYYVEVSGDQQHWERVVDYSDYHCRSWQYLYFAPRPVKFIRLVGTHNTVNRVFHVVCLEAKHTAKVQRLVGHFVAPKTNVATVEMSAIVTEGVSRTRHALINGDYLQYDWDSGYTCHQLRSGEIVVRLGQPYYLGSMRLLLWDLDDRTYSFYIEISTNRKDWEMIVDRRNDSIRSWQNFLFTPRPVVYIRIVGTRNTANEIFHCVHLECPTQDKNYLKKIAVMEEEREKKEKEKKTARTDDDNIASTSGSSLASGHAESPSTSTSSSQSVLRSIHWPQQTAAVVPLTPPALSPSDTPALPAPLIPAHSSSHNYEQNQPWNLSADASPHTSPSSRNNPSPNLSRSRSQSAEWEPVPPLVELDTRETL